MREIHLELFHTASILVSSFFIGLLFIKIIRIYFTECSDKIIDVLSLVASFLAIPFLLSDFQTLNTLNSNFNVLRTRVEATEFINQQKIELELVFDAQLQKLILLLDECVDRRLMPNDPIEVDPGIIAPLDDGRNPGENRSMSGKLWLPVLPVTRETCEDVRYKVEATRIGLADPTVFADDPNGTTEAKLEKIGLDQNAFSSSYVMDSGRLEPST